MTIESASRRHCSVCAGTTDRPLGRPWHDGCTHCVLFCWETAAADVRDRTRRTIKIFDNGGARATKSQRVPVRVRFIDRVSRSEGARVRRPVRDNPEFQNWYRNPRKILFPWPPRAYLRGAPRPPRKKVIFIRLTFARKRFPHVWLPKNRYWPNAFV